MRNVLFLAIILLVFTGSAQSVAAVCSGGFPDFFYGDVSIDNQPASVGTEIRALIDGDVRGTYTTINGGVYGNVNTDDKMLVTGDPGGYPDFPTIHFEVKIDGNFVDTGETATYQCGDVFTNPKTLDLSAASPACTDTDLDGVCDNVDACPGFDDHVDADEDGTPDGCDVCPLDPLDDADGDGVCGDVDICPGFDDNADIDSDGIPDGCDICTDVDLDAFCAEGLDCDDNDGNINPDANEICGDSHDNDCNGLTDDADPVCIEVPCDDADADGVCDEVDICPGFDDNVDSDNDGTPDGCDICPLDAFDDADADGVCGDVDICQGFDDNVDSDNDGTPDGCDICPLDALEF